MIKPRKQKLTRKEVSLIPLEECLARPLDIRLEFL